MSKPSNRTIKNKYAACNKGKHSMGIGEYLERIYFRQNCMGRLVDGVMSVLVNGVWLSKEDFDKLYPAPIVPHFNHDITNIDLTRRYLYE